MIKIFHLIISFKRKGDCKNNKNEDCDDEKMTHQGGSDQKIEDSDLDFCKKWDKNLRKYDLVNKI